MINSIYKNNTDSIRSAVWLFLAGLFSMTRINLGGSIAISEIAMIALAPILLLKNYLYMKKDKCLLLFGLSITWLIGAVFADWRNGTHISFALKGAATPIVMGSAIIFMYAHLKKDVRNIKWFILGVSLSYVLSTFVFQRAASLGLEEYSRDALERTIDYKLYWLNLVGQFAMLPVKGWYMSTPLVYSVFASIGMAGFSLFTGVRSQLLAFSMSALIILMGRKSYNTMLRIKRHLIIAVVLLGVLGLCLKNLYRYAAVSGMIGESERRKYERQSQGSDSALKLLMAGRVEFFVGLFAIKGNPVIGRGSWAIDTDGIYPEFVYRYGTDDDVRQLVETMRRNSSMCTLIPFHTHIITYWMWHGIFGLAFWLYALYLVIGVLKNRMYVVPELFGYFAIVIPSFLWDVFFSPLGARVEECALLVLCLLVKKINSQVKVEGY